MPSKTTYYDFNLYDYAGNLDAQVHIKQALDDMGGRKSNSALSIIDEALAKHDQQNIELNDKISSIISSDFKIFSVNLTLTSTTEASSVYSGSSTEFTEYKNGYIYLFKFNEANIGSVQFIINSIGFYSLKKVKNGASSELETNDLRKGVGYLVYYKDNQFELIGDNFNTEMKKYDPSYELATIEHNLNKYPVCELYRTTWAAGIGGAGEGPAGGTSLTRIGSNAIQVPGSVEYVDKSSVVIYTTQEYQNYTNINKVNDNEYALLAPDSDDTKISLVLILT